MLLPTDFKVLSGRLFSTTDVKGLVPLTQCKCSINLRGLNSLGSNRSSVQEQQISSKYWLASLHLETPVIDTAEQLYIYSFLSVKIIIVINEFRVNMEHTVELKKHFD
jgi:hypothetical protein